MKKEWWKNNPTRIRETLEGIVKTDIPMHMIERLITNINNAIEKTSVLRNQINKGIDSKYSKIETDLANFFTTTLLEDSTVVSIIKNLGISNVDPQNVINIMNECQNEDCYLLEAGEIVIPVGNTNGHGYTIGKMYEMLDYEVAVDHMKKHVDRSIMNNDKGSIIAANDEDVAIFITRRDLASFDTDLLSNSHFKLQGE